MIDYSFLILILILILLLLCIILLLINFISILEHGETNYGNFPMCIVIKSTDDLIVIYQMTINYMIDKNIFKNIYFKNKHKKKIEERLDNYIKDFMLKKNNKYSESELENKNKKREIINDLLTSEQKTLDNLFSELNINCLEIFY